MDTDRLLASDEKKKNLFTIIIEKIMIAVLAVCPFGLMVFKTGRRFMGMPQIRYKLIIALMVLGTLAACMIVARELKNSKRYHALSICMSLFIIGFALRVITCYILQAEPVSDFEQCYNYAIGKAADANYLANFPYLGACALTLKVLYLFVPKSLFWAQCLNAAITAFIPVLLYWTVRRMTKREDAAFLSGAFYAFYPGLIVYTSVPSCEHFSQFFMALTILAFVYAKSVRKGSTLFWLLHAVGGVSLGLMYIYKELFIIVAPAILMASFCYEVVPAAFEFRQQAKQALRKILMIIGWNTVILSLALTVYHVGINAIQMEIRGHVQDRNALIGAIVYEGLAPKGRGGWNPEVKGDVQTIIRQTNSNSEANAALFRALIDEYSEDPFEVFVVLNEKFETDWCNEGIYYYWTSNGDNNIIKGTVMGDFLFGKIATNTLTVMSFIIALGLLIRLFRNKTYGEGQGFFVVIGTVFLFMLALMLMEAQGRYKSSLMPQICMMAGITLTDTADIVGLHINRCLCYFKSVFIEKAS